jgi:hypothetical protein
MPAILLAAENRELTYIIEIAISQGAELARKSSQQPKSIIYKGEVMQTPAT